LDAGLRLTSGELSCGVFVVTILTAAELGSHTPDSHVDVDCGVAKTCTRIIPASTPPITSDSLLLGRRVDIVSGSMAGRCFFSTSGQNAAAASYAIVTPRTPIGKTMSTITALKGFILDAMPPTIRRRVITTYDLNRLSKIPASTCDASNLVHADDVKLDFLTSPQIEARWQEWKPRIDAAPLAKGAGGVNAGDRQAIFFLASHLNPHSVLEIGTHVGASTLHFAAALGDAADNSDEPQLVTVDISDVNDPAQNPELARGGGAPPREVLHHLRPEFRVEFVVDSSLTYMANTERRFDFIFLDGDHLAAAVYQEVPLALKILNPGGFILLHDYFPGNKPLWNNDHVIPGPYLGTERLKQEGAPLQVIPLGNLPWPTKLGSHTTSLALLARTS
jgi:predicted O-methyltransferase YrrM